MKKNITSGQTVSQKLWATSVENAYITALTVCMRRINKLVILVTFNTRNVACTFKVLRYDTVVNKKGILRLCIGLHLNEFHVCAFKYLNT